jgi:hypothetical protein
MLECNLEVVQDTLAELRTVLLILLHPRNRRRDLGIGLSYQLGSPPSNYCSRSPVSMPACNALYKEVAACSSSCTPRCVPGDS